MIASFLKHSVRVAGIAALTVAPLAAQLADEPTLRVEVGGHTDNTGQAAGNIRISQARANAVRTYLISKGIAADRLTAKGYGSSKPLAPNTTPANRTKNRRVELTPLP